MSHKTIKKLLLGLIISTTMLIPSSSYAFLDVLEDHPYIDAIEYIEEEGLSDGFPDGTFRPSHGVSQVEFLDIALKVTGNDDEYDENAIMGSFVDVQEDEWFYGTVETALQMGLIEQVPSQTYFYPDHGISKHEALRILFKLYNIDLMEAQRIEKVFADIKTNGRFVDVAKTAKGFDILELDKKTYFRPLKKITRGELANYIHKIETYKSPSLKIIQLQINQPSDSSLTQAKDFEVLEKIWAAIHERYLYQENIDDEKLIQAAIEGIIKELDDEYTSYEPPNTADQFIQVINGNLVGIGVEIHKIEDEIIIISVYQGTPAANAGLKPRDVIISVDKKDITGYSLIETAQVIRGEEGTLVRLTVLRDGVKINVSITREKLDIKEVTSEIIEGNIGLITITSFSQTAGVEFAIEVNYMKKKGAKGFILDLRNNPGGFLDTSIDVMSSIIPKNKIVTTLASGNGNIKNFFSEGPGTLHKKPLVVLINGGSASASEIVAGAVKDHDAGTLVGEISFGKGTVQDISRFSDGSFLKMTVAKWLTPKGKSIHKIGIRPDIIIRNTTSEDLQLKRAIKIIKEELED